MTSNPNEDAGDQALLAFLTAQRNAVLSIVAGLDEEAWHRSAEIIRVEDCSLEYRRASSLSRRPAARRLRLPG
jgi:hypothetical protein